MTRTKLPPYSTLDEEKPSSLNSQQYPFFWGFRYEWGFISGFSVITSSDSYSFKIKCNELYYFELCKLCQFKK